MTADIEGGAAAAPDGGLDLAPLAQALLEERLVLAFDAGTGVLDYANEAARAALFLPEELPPELDFQAMAAADGEGAADLWWNVVSGACTRWTGQLASPEGARVDVSVTLATQEEGPVRRILLAAEPREAGAPPPMPELRPAPEPGASEETP